MATSAPATAGRIRRPSRGLVLVVTASLAGGALFGALFGLVAWRSFVAAAEARTAARVLVAIPVGTGSLLSGASGATGASGVTGTSGEASDSGTPVLPPSAVSLAAGDTLVLRNDDTQPHEVGDYTIAPGSVLELTVGTADAGSFRCTFVQAGSFEVDVAPPLQAATLIVPAALIGLPVGGMFGLVGWFVRSLGEPDETAGGRKEGEDG